MKKLIVAIINLLVVTNSFVITELRQQSSHCFTSTSNESQRTERVRRALSFYSAALPLFIFYKALDFKIQLRKFSTVEGSLGDKNISVENIRLDEAAYDKLHEWGSKLITEKVVQLKGFYVKTGQIISTRVDIFPKQYTTKLAITQDRLDPVPTELIKDIVRQDLLNGADLCELFASFDEAPLGSASIAQVHRATLLDGRVVAVKVQRPGIRSKLLGDIKNLQTFAKLVSRSLLIDYYKIFLELEKTLVLELDFLHEAQATAKVAAAVAHAPNNKPQVNKKHMWNSYKFSIYSIKHLLLFVLETARKSAAAHTWFGKHACDGDGVHRGSAAEPPVC